MLPRGQRALQSVAALAAAGDQRADSRLEPEPRTARAGLQRAITALIICLLVGRACSGGGGRLPPAWNTHGTILQLQRLYEFTEQDPT